MALIDDLGGGPVGVDTAIFINFIEENEQFLPAIAPLFEAAHAGKFEIVASALTLLEVLVVPYRAGNIELAERYEAVLTRSRGVAWSILPVIICAWRRNCGRRPASPLPTRCSSPLPSPADAPPLSQTTDASRSSRG